MTLRNSKLTLTLSAAAVAIGLGASQAFAQQQQRGGESAQQQGAQQQGAQQNQSGSQQQQQSGQRSQQSAQSGSQQTAASQQRAGDSELDRVVQMHPELGTFVEAIEAAGLVEELVGDTQYTIFAPTNQAFESMQQDASELLEPGNREQLVALLRAHIVADDVTPQRARELTAAQTLDGETIELSTDNDKLMIGGASVVTPNIEVQGANLRIYSIDQVLDEDQRSASASDGRSRG
jgi:uncharacterized surface protein with fasciclin (FAS1) repeats